MEKLNLIKIEEETCNKIRQEIERALHSKMIFVCRESEHPDDNFLYRYVAYRERDNSFIAGMANTSRGDSVSLYFNHYDISLKTALEITAENLHYC